jgi:hypothetical protein
MNITQGRERALAALLSAQDISSQPDLPSQVTLPGQVHEVARQAILDTHGDERERKVGFRHIHGKWFAGIMRVGTSVKLLEDGTPTNASTGINLYVGRPHLHMHTHPSPNPERVQESVELRPHTQGWSQTRKAELSNRESNFHEGSYMLPSRGDLEATYSTSFGTLGNVIASSGGLFLSLRKDVRDRELLIPDEPENVKAILDEYKARFQFALKEEAPPLLTQRFLLRSAAGVLKNRYVCYFSEDPENPILARVEE